MVAPQSSTPQPGTPLLSDAPETEVRTPTPPAVPVSTAARPRPSVAHARAWGPSAVSLTPLYPSLTGCLNVTTLLSNPAWTLSPLPFFTASAAQAPLPLDSR